MSIDAILAQASAGEQVNIPEGWGQGRATFGGVIGAVMVARLQALVPDDRRLRSFSLSFVGPVAPGDVTVQATIFRSGKSVTQGQCLLLQNGEVQAAMLASYANARESLIKVPAKPTPVFKSPEASAAIPHDSPVLPSFLRRFNMHWAVGAFPFANSPETDLGGWVRFNEPTAAPTAAHIAALVDSWPPSVIGMYPRPAPNSSLTWTLELLDVDLGADGNAWWQYLAETDYADKGYAHISARLWRADGTLAVISRQTASIFI